MNDLLTPVDGRPDFRRWNRKNHTLVVKSGTTLLARVSRVRKGRWRAVMRPVERGPLGDFETFDRMEQACIWAEARLPLYELPGLA